MIKRVYLGSTGAVDLAVPTFYSSKVKLLDNTGTEVSGKWVEIAAQGSNSTGDAPRTIAVDQGTASDQP